jgi:hypothetical protein
MNELRYWWLEMNGIFDLLALHGHKLGVFNNPPPALLPSGEDFETSAVCKRCGDALYVVWTAPSTLSCFGELLAVKCRFKKSLRQQSAA